MHFKLDDIHYPRRGWQQPSRRLGGLRLNLRDKNMKIIHVCKTPNGSYLIPQCCEGTNLKEATNINHRRRNYICSSCGKSYVRVEWFNSKPQIHHSLVEFKRLG